MYENAPINFSCGVNHAALATRLSLKSSSSIYYVAYFRTMNFWREKNKGPIHVVAGV